MIENEYEKMKKEKEIEKKDIKKTDANFVVKKQSEVKKFTSRFFAEDAKDVGEYLVSDVIIPKIQGLIHDSLTFTIDFLFYGRSGANKKKESKYGGSYVSYRDYANGGGEPVKRPKSSSVVSIVRDIECIEFPTILEAEKVISDVVDVINRYDSCSVADLCDILEIPNTVESNNYGWYDVDGFDVVRKQFSTKYLLRCGKITPFGK